MNTSSLLTAAFASALPIAYRQLADVRMLALRLEIKLGTEADNAANTIMIPFIEASLAVQNSRVGTNHVDCCEL